MPTTKELREQNPPMEQDGPPYNFRQSGSTGASFKRQLRGFFRHVV
jgi:hypothetical protein